MFLKNRNIISKIKRSKVTDYAASKLEISIRLVCLPMTFSTLYTTLPHNLIKDKLIDLIEITCQRGCSPYLACNDRNAFLLKKSLKISCIVVSKCM